MLLTLIAAAFFVQATAPAEPKPLQEIIRQVDTALKEQRSGDAINLLRKTLKTSPQWRRGWWLLGSVFYDADNYAAARPVLEHLVQLDPKSGGPWMLLGLCEFEMKDYGPALQHLQRGDAFGIPPELNLLDVVRYHEALLLMLAGRFDPAQVLLDQLARKGLDTEEVTLTQGLIALRIPAFPASLSRTSSPDRLEIIRRVGRAQHALALEKSADALQIYRALVSENPQIDNLHLSFAAALLQAGDRQAAQAELRMELKQNPQSVEARLHLCARLEDDSPEEALSLAEQAIALEPKSFKAHFARGKALFKVKKLEESAKELEMSRDLDPSSSAVRFALIRTYKWLGRDSEATREAAIFRRLKIAENQFHSSGQVPASYFEPDPSGARSPAAK
jgi:predicted Zn-dependent protease